MVSKFLKHLSSRSLFFILIIESQNLSATESIKFSSGAPLIDFQASIISPILAEAFAAQNIEFSVVHSPGLRSLQLSNSGQLDGELNRVVNFHEITNNEYSNLIKIDCKLLSVRLAAFASRQILINDWQDFKHYDIAYYRSRKDVDKHLEQLKTKNNIYKVNTDIQAFQMLAAGRVDIVISEDDLGQKILNDNIDLKNIIEIKQFSQTDIYSYINKKSYTQYFYGINTWWT